MSDSGNQPKPPGESEPKSQDSQSVVLPQVPQPTPLADQKKPADQKPDTSPNPDEKAGEKDESPDSGGTVQMTQAQLEALIKERLGQQKRQLEAIAERERRQTEEAAAEQQRVAEEAQLAEQKKFQELAESRHKQLLAVTTERDTLRRQIEEQHTPEREALRRYLEKERDGVPAHILTLLDKESIPSQLDWLRENRETLIPSPGSNGKSNGSSQQRQVPPTPRPEERAGGPSPDDLEEARRINQQQFRRGF